MIHRTYYVERINTALSRSPATALLGPRQCGKTTLAREVAKQHTATIFDLESPRDQFRLQNPELALGKLNGLVILDEVQRSPDLLPVLRVLIDRPNNTTRFLLLGSASPALLKGAGESLAGRIEFVDLHGFDLRETEASHWEKNWLRGGFPNSFLAPSDEDSTAWREGFIRTFLQQDLPQFGIQVPEPTMRRFWVMLSHAHGQILNSSGLARSMGMSDKTIRQYIDHLEQTYMLRVLPPWFENIKKRQVKSPKIYIRDSGLLHTLLSVSSSVELEAHPIRGASWEGYAIEQLLRIHSFQPGYFWATHASAELDLFVLYQGKRLGFEIKYQEHPKTTKSMHIAIQDLGLSHLYVVYPGEHKIPLDKQITAIGLQMIENLFEPGVA